MPQHRRDAYATTQAGRLCHDSTRKGVGKQAPKRLELRSEGGRGMSHLDIPDKMLLGEEIETIRGAYEVVN